MSDYERHKGILVKVDTDLTKGQFVSKLIEDNKIKIPEYYNLTKEEDFDDFCQDIIFDYGFYFSGNNIYSYKDEEVDPYADIFEYSQKEDGSIEYQFKFYNGGTCFPEQIENLIEKIEGN